MQLVLLKQYSCYNVGEVAVFPEDIALRLIANGTAKSTGEVPSVAEVAEIVSEVTTEEVAPDVAPEVATEVIEKPIKKGK